MKLILFGGVQGVGKTTLLSWLEKKYAGRITVMNAGELFRHYYYRRRIKTIDEIEELIVRTLQEMPRHAVVVLHWHYAVPRPTGYVPQIGYSRLRRIARSSTVEQMILLLVEAPVALIQKRRVADRNVKKRALSEQVISDEVVHEERFWNQQYKLLANIRGARRVTTLRLTNKSLRKAKAELRTLFEKLVT